MHPLVKILYFILALLLISVADNIMLLVLLISFCIAITGLRVNAFFLAVRRMRWLFLSILMIYAFGTPGELVPQFPVDFAPSYEGLQLGMLQIEKLLIALAALSLLLTNSPKEQMMLGLYMLLIPFKFIGLNIERFSARLMLTLNYVEELAAQDKSGFSFRELDDIHTNVESMPQGGVVIFQKLPFNMIDKLLMLLLAILLIFMVYRGFV